MRSMSLSLAGMPDGQTKGQSELPCPSVYAPASALRSLSSVALSSAPANRTLSSLSTLKAVLPHLSKTLSSTFLFEATNRIWSTFLREAIGLALRAGASRISDRRSQIADLRSQTFQNCDLRLG